MTSASDFAYVRVCAFILLLFGFLSSQGVWAGMCFPVDYEDSTGPESCPVGELLVTSQNCTHEEVGNQCVLMCQNVCVPDGAYVASWVNEFGVSVNYDELGAMPGSGGVANGAGSYQVPLELVPGKLAPDLMLAYNSHSGNGVVGSGWNLSGLSSISRCVGTIAQDGRIETVDYDDNDNFCLDGQRLVKLSDGFDVELNAEVTEYRLIQEQFIRVRRVHDGASYFVVEGRDGIRLEYGNDVDSLFEMLQQPIDKAIGWGLNRVIDVSGNYREYRYFNSLSGFDYLLSVEYGGNLNEGTNHYARVSFDYSQGNNLRPDRTTGFIPVLGSKMNMDRLLRRIRTEVKVNGDYQDVKWYGLDYGLSQITGLSTLTSITECDANGSCLQPTQFSWEENYYSHHLGPDKPINLALDNLCHNEWSGCKAGDDQYQWYVDIDGNGMDDFCYLAVKEYNGNVYIHEHGLQCRLSTEGSGIFSQHVNVAGFPCRWDIGECNSSDNLKTARFADVNADGKMDFVIRHDIDGVLVYEYNPDTLSFAPLYTTGICDSELLPFPPILRCDYNNIYLGDLNGDKLLDLGYRDRLDGLRFFLNDGAGFNGGEISLEGLCREDDDHPTGCNSLDNYSTIRLMDMNADGRADIVYRGDKGIQIWTAQQTYNNEVSFMHWAVTQICGNDEGDCDDKDNHAYIYYPDVNGDGLPDVCYRSDTGIRCHFNVGAAPLAISPFKGGDIEMSLCKNGQPGCDTPDNYRTIQFTDWNVDGKSDLVVRQDEGIRIYLSKGEEFKILSTEFSDLCADGSQGYGGCDGWDNHSTIRFANIDGKGSLELLYRSNDGIRARSTWFNEQPIGMMTQVVDGLGIETEFDYKPLTDSSVYEQLEAVEYPLYHSYGPQYVVSQLSTSDGLGSENVTTYQYRQQVLHLLGWGSLGFKEIESHNVTANTKDIVHYKHGNYPQLYGKLIEQWGYVWHNNAWVLVNNTNYGWGATTMNDGDIARYRVNLATKHVKEYELDGSWYRTNYTGYQYDEYSNLEKEETDTYGVDGLYYTIRKDTEYQYDLGNSWALSLGLVKRESVTKTVPEETLLSQVLVAETDMPSITNVVEYQYYPNGLVKRETREPDHAEYKLMTSYKYDGFGNVTKETQSGIDITSRIMETSYTPNGLYEVFKWTTVNGILHQKETQYDARFGLLTQETSINGHAVIYNYDNYGRLLQTDFADGSWEKIRRYACDANCSSLPLAVYYLVTSHSTGSKNRVFYDQANRELRKQTQLLDGSWSTVDVEYNTKGQGYRQSEPYFMGDDVYWTEKIYDVLGRVEQIMYPDLSTSSMVYNGLTQTETNAKNQSKTIKANVIGQTKEVTDTLGNVMKYYYDAQGNERAIQDHADANQANFVVMYYDLLGQKRGMRDPDMGLWEYDYNVFGELTLQRDGKGNEVWNQYDTIGRLVKREEFTLDDGLITTDWMFDTQPHGIGQLAEVISDAYDYQYYEYDELSRVKQVTTTIDGESYTMGTTYYPNSSQVNETIYPTGFTVAHIYNEYGYVTQVVNSGEQGFPNQIYWEALAMDARGNVEQFRLGNGVETTQYHDPVTGMLKDNVSVSAGNLWMVQDEHYQFDALGNLEERVWFTGEETYRETFEYDQLNRLRWSRTYDGFNIEKHTIGTSYDYRGNITYKSGVGEYVYGGDGCTGENNQLIQAGPHVVTAIINGPQNNSYCYDQNGNRTYASEKDQNLYYTAFNKVKRIEQGMNSEEPLYTTFHYAADRSLAKRIDHPWNANGEKSIHTTYVGGIYENVKEYMFANLQTEKHRHYIGDYAVVVFETGELTEAQYFHRDHLGSLVATSNGLNVQTDLVQERFNFDAWGQRRQMDLNAPELDLFEFKPVLTESSESFGGHKGLDSYGLVNMGGRVYDPIIARFIQADPVIQAPSNLQNLNRYTYVLNNPLSYTDPSGYFWQTLLGIGAAALSFVNPALGIVAGLLIGMATSIATNDPSAFIGAALGTITGGLGNFIGAGLQGAAQFGVTVLKGAASGAVGGGITSGLVNGWEYAGQGAWRGGLSGALASATTYGVNQAVRSINRKASHSESDSFYGGRDDGDKKKKIKLSKNLKPRVVGNEEMDKAAVEALNSKPAGKPFENGYFIRKNENGKYYFKFYKKLGVNGDTIVFPKDGDQIVGFAHDHPLYTNETIKQYRHLSGDAASLNKENAHSNKKDTLMIKKNKIPNYYRTPTGDAIKVIERVHIVRNNGRVVGRIKTRTVWENGKFVN